MMSEKEFLGLQKSVEKLKSYEFELYAVERERFITILKFIIEKDSELISALDSSMEDFFKHDLDEPESTTAEEERTDPEVIINSITESLIDYINSMLERMLNRNEACILEQIVREKIKSTKAEFEKPGSGDYKGSINKWFESPEASMVSGPPSNSSSASSSAASSSIKVNNKTPCIAYFHLEEELLNKFHPSTYPVFIDAYTENLNERVNLFLRPLNDDIKLLVRDFFEEHDSSTKLQVQLFKDETVRGKFTEVMTIKNNIKQLIYALKELFESYTSIARKINSKTPYPPFIEFKRLKDFDESELGGGGRRKRKGRKTHRRRKIHRRLRKTRR
jgi:hypothetical protein